MNRNEASFLKAVDNDRNKVTYTRIEILDQHEKPIKSIEGRVMDGSSVSLNGSSSVRRTCTLNVIAEEAENDLTNIDNFLSINRKVKIYQGIKYNINLAKDILRYDNANAFPAEGAFGKIYLDRSELKYYLWGGTGYDELESIFNIPDNIIWFPLGVFVITQPSLTHNTSNVNISLNLQDKMCLLNGSMGGGLPTSITFHEYDQVIAELVCDVNPKSNPNLELNEYTIYKYDGHYYKWTRKYGWEDSDGSEIGTIAHIPQKFYDIIQTLVIRWGNESPSRVVINDVPLEIKQLTRWTSSKPLYFNASTGQYTMNEVYLTTEGAWKTFNFNEDVGYTYTDFVYPGKLISNIGDTVTAVLDKIIQQLGNYEYFYDIEGNFVFQEKRNYLNTSYLPLEIANNTQKYYLDNSRREDNDGTIILEDNNLCILGQDNYEADFYGDQKSIYTFEEQNNLITAYTNSPVYTNIKNDYHIWGKNTDGYAIHYHLVVKDKPKPTIYNSTNQTYNFPTRQIIFLTKEKDPDTYSGMIRLVKDGETGIDYTPNDWRAELYLQGLEIQRGGGRPDIYQQELLDLFDSIYEWGYYDNTQTWIPQGRFKADIAQQPNNLQYFMDYLEPVNNLYSISVDDIGTKMFSQQQDKIVRLYDNEVPNYLIIDKSMDDNYKNMIMEKSDYEGQPHSIVDKDIYSNLAIGTIGYSAQETVRNYLYQYSSYNESISLQCVPIYYIDVNRRITVKDKRIGINSDFIINSITMPLSPNSTMSVSAVRALNRLPIDHEYEEKTIVAYFEEPYVVFNSNGIIFENDDTLVDTVGDILSFNSYIVEVDNT